MSVASAAALRIRGVVYSAPTSRTFARSHMRHRSPLLLLLSLLLAVLCVASTVMSHPSTASTSVDTISLSMKEMGHNFLTPAVEARAMRRQVLRNRQAEKAEKAEKIRAGVAGEKVRVSYDDPDVTLSEWIDDRPHNESIFMPSECNYNTRSCCLSYNGSVCGGPSRGVCHNVTADDQVCQRSLSMFWFTDSFDLTCMCSGNFWGVACEKCKTGWRGSQCDERAPFLVRSHFATLSNTDKQYVIDGFRLAKITPHPYQPSVSVFDYWALLHHWALPSGVLADRIATDGLPDDVAEGHDGSGAIMYHRSLVGGMERGLQYALGNDSFAMPYWNWTGSQGNDNDLTLKWFGGDGDTVAMLSSINHCRLWAQPGEGHGSCGCVLSRGPFAQWPLVGDWAYPLEQQVIQRAFGCRTIDAPNTPSQMASDCSVRIDRFDKFQEPGLRQGHNDTEALPDPLPDATVTDPNIMLRRLSPHHGRAKGMVRAQVSVGDDAGTGVFFHNLLGGDILCGDVATWPLGQKVTDMHKRAHQWLSGTMIGPHPASDPLFWMLHSYADTVFEQWVRTAISVHHLDVEHSWAKDTGALGNLRLDCQGPFYPLMTHFSVYKDSRDLGFTYDIFKDDISKPEFRGAYYDNEWHWPYPHMDPLRIDDDVKLVVKDTATPAIVPQDTSFFLPIECGTELSSSSSSSGSYSSASCCPLFQGQVCGGVSRGTCKNITENGVVADLAHHPGQLWWVTSFFTAVCVCSGNFDGVDCAVCKPGYEGISCNITSLPRVRRDFNTLSTDDMQYITDAFRIARQAQSIYQPGVTVLAHFASTVYWALPGHSYFRASDAAPHTEYAYHGALPWRRELLSRLERELGRITGNDSFVLPYWDWSHAYTNDQEPVYRFFGGDGSTNASVEEGQSTSVCRRPYGNPDGFGGCNCSITRLPFSRPPTYGLFAVPTGIVQRTFACFVHVAPSLPHPDVVDYTAGLENYYFADDHTECFSKALTGVVYEQGVQTWPHGLRGDMMARVQNFIAGTMTTPDLDSYRTVKSSPGSDPMYYLALGYADLIFERWIRRAGADSWRMGHSLLVEGAETGLNRGEVLAPFFPLKTNEQAFVTSLKAGYTYDFFDDHHDDLTYVN